MGNKTITHNGKVRKSDITREVLPLASENQPALPVMHNELSEAIATPSTQLKKNLAWKVLDSQESLNFLKSAKFTVALTNSPPKATINDAQPSTSGYKQPNATINDAQPSTSGYRKPKLPTDNAQPSTSGYKPKTSTKSKQPSKQTKKQISERISKVSHISKVIQKLGVQKKIEICDKIKAIEFTNEDIHCQMEYITAKLFCRNLFVFGREIIDAFDNTKFMEVIKYGIRLPKYVKNGPLGVDELFNRADTKHAQPIAARSFEWFYDLTKGDLQVEKQIDCGLLFGFIPDMTEYEWSDKFSSTMMRYHKILIQTKIVKQKIPANELNLTYNPKMARQCKTLVLRDEVEQVKRDKNTIATRVTRAREKYNTEQLYLQSTYIEYSNYVNTKRLARMMVYLNVLLRICGDEAKDFMLITDRLIAIEFMMEQELLINQNVEERVEENEDDNRGEEYDDEDDEDDEQIEDDDQMEDDGPMEDDEPIENDEAEKDKKSEEEELLEYGRILLSLSILRK